jgi:hypothetical protein
MIHLAAFTKTSVGNIVDEDIPAVSDQVFTISNNHFIPPVPVWVILAAAACLNITRWKISTPRLRAIAQPQFPRGTAAAGIGFQAGVIDMTNYPIKLNPIDELSALVTTNVVAATQPTAGVWLTDGNIVRPRGEPYWVHGTSTVTDVAFGWAAAAITLDQTLPAGQYSVIGLRVIGANAQFGRLIFPTGGWRPGCIAVPSIQSNEGWYFENGYLGEMGRFASVAQPLLEVFATVAGATTYDVFLELLKL